MFDRFGAYLRSFAIASLLCAWAAAFAQELPGPDDPEDVLVAKLPNGNYVEVGVNDDTFEYELDVYNKDLKQISTLDGSAFWADDFVPALLCPIDNERVLALDRPVEKGKRPGIIVNIKTGKLERKVGVALPQIRSVWLLRDNTLLAFAYGELIEFNKDGQIIWDKTAVTDESGKKLPIAKIDAVTVTDDGSIAMLQNSAHRIMIFDDKFRYRSRINFPKNRYFTQQIGPGKNCFWFEDEIDGNKLVRVGKDGKISERTMVFSDNLQMTYVQFMGETSKGDPVFYFMHLFAVPQNGRMPQLEP